MDFFNSLYLLLDSFFTSYNHNTLWWYLVDNFLPTKLSLITLNTLDYLFIFFENLFINFVNLSNSLLSFFSLGEIFLSFGFTSTMLNAISIALNFLLCIAILIFASGGIPSFRFDYLTKLGWISFLSLVLLSFLVEVLLLSMV